MDISVYFDGERQTAISYRSVVCFRLFCEQQGLYTAWNPAAKRIDLSFHSKQSNLSLSAADQHPFSVDILEELKQFLSSNGMTASFQEDRGSISDFQAEIQLEIIESETALHPFLSIEHHSSADERLWNILLGEFNDSKLAFELNGSPVLPSLSAPCLHLTCSIPSGGRTAQLKEQISMSLARSILRYIHPSPSPGFLSYLPAEMMKSWLQSTSNFTAHVSPSERHIKAVKANQEKTMPAQLPAERSIRHEHETISITKAELFFDFTVLPPQTDSEEKEYLISGNLYMKNTGTSVLRDPVICIKITPAEGASLQGQIIPPKLVSGLSTKSNGVEKGWKYMYDDWKERIRTKGEYWIIPIQPVEIISDETAAFHSFKISISEPQKNGYVLVEGFAYFNEGQHQFSSNNRISFSF
jgi:hypothetical protein